MLDFKKDLEYLRPDIFFVNEDGHRSSKEEVCKKLGIEYVVSKRKPEEGLEERSSTSIKRRLASENDEIVRKQAFPWRLCISGGWLDQPDRSGLATSTRNIGIKLWGTMYTDPGTGPLKYISQEEAAYLLFGAENPPGKEYISGSQDAIGLMLSGISKLNYQGAYWPCKIERLQDKKITSWLEDILWLLPLPSRPEGYDPIKTRNLQGSIVEKLAEASKLAWKSIVEMDANGLGKSFDLTRQAWRELLPETVPLELDKLCDKYKNHKGCLFSGSGGGFLMIISDNCVENAFQVRITDKESSIMTRRSIR